LDAARVRTLPVDLQAMTDVLGVTIHVTSLLSPKVDAVYFPGLAAIALNSRKPRVRQRFSLAHEIAECALGRAGVNVHIVFTRHDLPRHDGARERACDRFAAEILVPERFLTRRLLAQARADPGEVARIFGVSQACLRLRLAEIDPSR
jgi:Zn-dependent peptidase ImmA (M78 family)